MPIYKILDSDKDRLLHLYLVEDKSVDELGVIFKVSKNTIRAYLKRFGVTLKGSFDINKVPLVIEMFKNGSTISDITRFVNTSKKTVYKILKESGDYKEFKDRGIKLECPSYSGYEELSGKHFSKIKKGAKLRNINFDISIEETWCLFEKQGRKCALSGQDIILKRNCLDKNAGEQTASLDRIDSSKGYTIDNVQWVHKRINIMKNNMSDTEFINWCKAVAKKEEVESQPSLDLQLQYMT